MSLRLLPPEEKDELIASLAESYGFNTDALVSCEMLEGEESFWAVSPAVIGLPLRKMRTDSIGILIARGRLGGLTPTVAALQLFARPSEGTLSLSPADALKFVERKAIDVDAPDGRHVVFYGGRAIDLGRVREDRLLRVQSGKPRD